MIVRCRRYDSGVSSPFLFVARAVGVAGFGRLPPQELRLERFGHIVFVRPSQRPVLSYAGMMKESIRKIDRIEAAMADGDFEKE